jgi:hypothetical protein
MGFSAHEKCGSWQGSATFRQNFVISPVKSADTGHASAKPWLRNSSDVASITLPMMVQAKEADTILAPRAARAQPRKRDAVAL